MADLIAVEVDGGLATNEPADDMSTDGGIRGGGITDFALSGAAAS